MSFVKDYLNGKASPEDIDSYVDKWHEGTESELDLHEYLGLSWEEYQEWATHPSKMEEILESYKF